jgi:MFS family permease
MEVDRGAPPRTSPVRLMVLLTVALCINYIDRGNLATAAPLIQQELKLSAAQLGVLLSAFYYGYVACMAPVGWLAERHGAQRVLAAGVAIWSAATLMTGFAAGFASLLALRVLLGVGESGAFPCASKLMANAVAVRNLGLANGALGFGYLVGPAIGTLLGGLLMSQVGWRPVFVLFGAASLLWLWPWARVVIEPQPAAAAARAAPDDPTFGEILRQRGLWGAALGHFSSNYSFYFILAWLPFYLVRARGFSMQAMAWIASWAYLLNAASALLMGWIADRWIRAGRSADVIYKGGMVLNHVGGVACMAGMVMLPAAGSIAALFVCEILCGIGSPGVFAIPQIMAGPRAAGRWVGVQNAIGNMAGFAAPALTGILVDQTGQFDLAFALAAGVNLLGLIGWVWVLPPIAPLDWAGLRRRAHA